MAPLSRLLAEEALQRQVAALAAGYGPGTCRLAAVSEWSLYLFAGLVSGLALLSLRGGALPADPLIATGGSRPSALVLTLGGPGGAAASLEGSLTPAVERLARQSGLAPRLYWSNAANMLAFLCEAWEGRPGLARRVPPLRRLLEAPPLQGHITYPAPGGQRRRRLCCLRDRLPGHGLCAACPKVKSPLPREKAASGRSG